MSPLIPSKRKICVVTGSRADYGLLYWVMRRIRDDADLELRVLVTGAHLSAAFGYTWTQIETDGFAPLTKVDMHLTGDDAVAVTDATGRGLAGMGQALASLKPDLMMVLGDRYEILAAATAATIARIPIAHIAGGDVTEGAFDDAIRHAVTKLSHLHFVTNELSARRVRQMGEEPSRVHVVGSPGLDVIRHLEFLDRAQLEKQLGVAFRKRNLLVTFHPVTLDAVPSDRQLGELLHALALLGTKCQIFLTAANADPEGRRLNAQIRQWAAGYDNARFFESLGQQRYLSLMAQVDAVVGNSSCGLYEAPALGVPTVNIGDRQAGRLRAASVLDCPPEQTAIIAAIRQAFDRPRSAGLTPYGDGHASERIVEVLRSIPDFRGLLRKRFVGERDSYAPATT